MLNPVTIILYLLGATTQFISLFKRSKYQTFWLEAFGIPAVLLHAALLHAWIDQTSGQNLTEFNLLSLATWVIALTILMLALKRSTGYLAISVFPFAAVSIFLVNQFPSIHILNTGADSRELIHILLSVVTFSVLMMAGLQAITLAIQEKLLRQKYVKISNWLPPLETMEKWLFQLIGFGAILLSFVLFTSVYFFHDKLFSQFLQKTILTTLAWVVFIILLIGRHYFGWRGKKAMYYTLSGVMLLTLTYFSSLLLLELLP